MLLSSFLLVGCSTKSSKQNQQSSKMNESENSSIEMSSSGSTDTDYVKTEANTKYYSYLDDVDRSAVHKSVIESFTMYDKEDPKTLKEMTSNIFIAKVVSIDKADVDANVEGVESDNLIPDTYGKLEVLKNLEGTADKEVQFIRTGGIIKEKDRYRNAPEDEKKKHNELRAEAGRAPITESEDWIEVREEGDIELQTGEIYLFFATYDEDRKAYFLTGFEYGALLLEDADQPIEVIETEEDEIGKTWEIKNESTGQEENLGEYLEKELELNVKEK